MPKFLKFLLSLFIFWLLVFNLHRVVFLLLFARGLHVNILQITGAFYHSLSLDLSAAAYFSVVPFLLGFISLFIGSNTQGIIVKSIRVYLIVLLVLLCLVQAGDVSVYPEWQVKLPYKALEHLRHPMEPLLTASPVYLFAFFGTFLFELVVGLLLYRWLVKRNLPQWQIKPSVASIALFTIIGGIVFLFIRGGWGQFPISVSAAYYSDKSVLNDASLNSAWQFGGEVWAHFDRDDAKLYHYYPKEEANKVFATLYPSISDTTDMILKIPRPNVVVILLESWSADVVGSLGEFKGLTPNFDSLAKQGVLFTNCYANSWMSEKGNVAVLSGMPSLPTVSIFDRSNIFRKLPTINQSLQAVGYHSSYYYGGFLDFGNIRGFLLDHSFQKIVDRQDIGNQLPMGKLGVHDGDMMPYFLSQLSIQQQPFFSVLFTLSTHLPYDFPGQKSGADAENVEPYNQAIKYSDKALGQFFIEAAKQTWYNNTLFLLVSDHSHTTDHYRQPWEKDRFRIPMLLVGPPINDVRKGKQIDKLCSQMDIANTLLTQLELSHKSFTFSRNIFADPSVNFAPYAYTSGCGWIDSDSYAAWDIKNSRQANDSTSSGTSLHTGKSFFQVLGNTMLQ